MQYFLPGVQRSAFFSWPHVQSLSKVSPVLLCVNNHLLSHRVIFYQMEVQALALQLLYLHVD
jgi:hypothetical protein